MKEPIRLLLVPKRLLGDATSHFSFQPTSRCQVALVNALFPPSSAWAPLIPLIKGGVRGDFQVPLTARFKRPPLTQSSQAAGLSPGWLPAFQTPTGPANQWPGCRALPAPMVNQ